MHLWPVESPTKRIVNNVPERDVNLERESGTRTVKHEK